MTFQAEGPVPPPIIQEKLTILVGSWGGRFAPLYDNDCHAYGINHGGFLIRSDRNRQYIDGLATAWAVSADGLTWTFTIRDDATFHDGTPVTVEDVEFTWRQTWGPGALDVATSPTASANAINTSNIEISGTNQVSVTHHELNPSFLNSMSDATSSCQGVVLPKHFWDGYEVHDQGRALAYDQNPIAAGPLRIREIRPGELMAFESFADYYAKDRAIKIQNVNLIKAPEEATRVAALRAGEADIVPVSLAYREQVEAGGGRLLFGPEGNYISVRLDGCWHDSDFSCGDKRVRQALEYAIDKELIRDRLYGGPEVFQVKGWAHVTPSSIGYSTHLNPYLYDPDKARRLLAEAGYKTLTNPEGKDFGKLIVNTWVSSSIPLLPESAQLAADFWRRELGIDAEVRVGDEALIKAIRRDGGLAGQVTWGDNRDRLDGYSISRSNYATPEQTDRLSNDPELHALAKATLSVTDLTERPQAMNQLYRRLRDETHELGIGYANIPWGVGPRVESWTPQPMALYPSALHTAILK
jgi:peptide/nickel transport system substrate-binding protein